MDRPARQARDFKGALHAMPTPPTGYRFRASYNGGYIELWADRADFAVVYGLQLKSGLSYSEAAAELGACLMHAAQCDGLLD